MRSLGIRSVLDFINTITEKDIETISEIFKFPIEIMKIELNPYKNVTGNIQDFELQLPLNSNIQDMCLHRKGDKISVLITTG